MDMSLMRVLGFVPHFCSVEYQYFVSSDSTTLKYGNLAEWSKAIRSGRIHVNGEGSNPSVVNLFILGFQTFYQN
jgi:hypothetical protein